MSVAVHVTPADDDVIDDGADDLPECCSDNDADGHIDDVAAHGELFELVEHSVSSLGWRCPMGG